MKLTIDCPNGEYREEMRIYCRAMNGWCGNQYFRRCKGWWALTDNASKCPVRRRTAEDLRTKTMQTR